MRRTFFLKYIELYSTNLRLDVQNNNVSIAAVKVYSCFITKLRLPSLQ